LLRREQGILEIERFRYERNLAPYDGHGSDGDGNKDYLLLNRVAQSAQTVAEAWSTFMPPSTDAAKVLASGHK